MNKRDMLFLIEKEYFEFLLNVQNNYKDVAREHFDVFVSYVEDAYKEKIIGKRRYKKYKVSIDKYNQWFNGEEEALLKAVKPRLFPELTAGTVVYSIVALICIIVVIAFFVLIGGKRDNNKEAAVFNDVTVSYVENNEYLG